METGAEALPAGAGFRQCRAILGNKIKTVSAANHLANVGFCMKEA